MTDRETSEEPASEPPEVPETDRRKQQRTKIDIKRTILATIEQKAGYEGRCHLHLLDLSEGGMRINVDQTLEPEDTVCLKFDLSPLGALLEGSFESECRVAWAKPTPGGTVTGLQFTELKEGCEDGLQRLLEFWSKKSSLDLTKLWKPLNFKLRLTDDAPWSRTLFIQSLSEKGFQFKAIEPLETEQTLQSRLLLNNGPVVTPARVRWCTKTIGQGYDAGCEFEDLSEEDRLSIELHLKRTGHSSFRK